MFKFSKKRFGILAFFVAIVAPVLISSSSLFTDRESGALSFSASAFEKDGYTLECEAPVDYYTAGETVSATLKETNAKGVAVDTIITMSASWTSPDPDSKPWGNADSENNAVLTINDNDLDYSVNEDGTISFALPDAKLAAGASAVERVLNLQIPATLAGTGSLNFSFDGVTVKQSSSSWSNDYSNEDLNSQKSVDFSADVVWDVSEVGGSKDVVAQLSGSGTAGEYGLKILRNSQESDDNGGKMLNWPESNQTPWSAYSITALSIGDGVESIGDYAFAGETGITGITFPDSVAAIGKSAFAGSGLTGEVRIPATVGKIDRLAFADLPNVNEFTFEHSSSDTLVLPSAGGADTGAFYVSSYIQTLINCNNETIENYDWVTDNRMKAGINSVTLTYDDVEVGKTVDPDLVILPDNAEPYQSIQYEIISGSAYASVDADTGVVTGVAEGTATIKVTIVDANGKNVTAEATVKVIIPQPGVLEQKDGWYTQGGTSIARNTITSIEIVDFYDTTDKTIIDQWDASTESTGRDDEEGPITAYIEDDGLGNNTYKLTLSGNGTGSILASRNSYGAFGGDTYNSSSAFFTSVQTIKGLNLLDTSNTTNMGYMFAKFGKYASLDLSSFDTSNVTNMNGMFSECYLKDILFPDNFGVSAENMGGMFQRSYVGTAIDFSKFSTSNVTSFSAMFRYGIFGNSTIDLSSWDVSGMLEAEYMFCDTKFTSIDLHGWSPRTGNFRAMFASCSNLVSLDLSGWNTENVSCMNALFNDCSSLQTLDLSSWDTSKVTDMINMFKGCTKLTTIYVSDLWSTESVTSSTNMFYYCNRLIGGNGTKFSYSYPDASYARIDTTDTPGYFTYKAAPAAASVASMSLDFDSSTGTITGYDQGN